MKLRHNLVTSRVLEAEWVSGLLCQRGVCLRAASTRETQTGDGRQEMKLSKAQALGIFENGEASNIGEFCIRREASVYIFATKREDDL